jgi:hypothetical protein
MKRVILLLAVLPGCATLLKEPDWKFDCDWARFYDFQNNARSRLSGLPEYSQFSKMLCDQDPSTLEYWERRNAPERPPTK